MATKLEHARLAAAVNLLRPSWPTNSLQTILDRDHGSRPIADLAVALVAVAVDPDSKTPARLSEPGPWWNLARPEPTGQPPNVAAVLARVEAESFVPASVGVPSVREALANRRTA